MQWQDPGPDGWLAGRAARVRLAVHLAGTAASGLAAPAPCPSSSPPVHLTSPPQAQPLTFFATPLRKAEGGLAGAITDLAGYMREAAAGAGGGTGT